MLHPAELSSSMESLVYDASVGSPGNGQQQRTKRMRTSFKHHQLRTMKSYFAINQNPDAKDLKQLAQKTGLSKRVLQVGTTAVLRVCHSTTATSSSKTIPIAGRGSI
jgi:LIM homeobox protein 2/9